MFVFSAAYSNCLSLTNSSVCTFIGALPHCRDSEPDDVVKKDVQQLGDDFMKYFKDKKVSSMQQKPYETEQ